MKIYKLIWITVLGISTAAFSDKNFVVIIPSYNNEQWCERNIASVLRQDYEQFRIVYVNDASEDNNIGKLISYVKNNHKDLVVNQIDFDASVCKNVEETVEALKLKMDVEDPFLIVVNNIHRAGALANLYRTIHTCLDSEIIVTLDGDDWFAHNNVLRDLNQVYSLNNREVWITHGRLKEHPNGATNWCIPIPQEVVKTNTFRFFRCPSHLRTFYAWLFKKIELDDLLYEGEFFPMTWDMAMMYPMMEMAGERHYFMKTVNYIYNISNPINDNKVDPALQNFLDQYIRNNKPYERLP